MALDKESFWVKANEQKFEADAILKELMENFSTKAPGNMTWPVRISLHLHLLFLCFSLANVLSNPVPIIGFV